ncbi:aromatic-ring hydroxylase C-terminal domain-containing protein [Kocuria palustris]
MTKVSTHDLAPYRRFTLFTGVTGAGWAEAAQEAASSLGIDLETVVIGPGQEVTDLYSDWERLRGVDEDGAVLVRPDKHIGWRSQNLPEDPAAALRDALASILSVTTEGAGA